MKSDTFFITPEAAGWRIARIGADGKVEIRETNSAPADAVDVVDQALAGLLKELGHDSQAACLGLPSDMVLSAEIETGDGPRRDQRAVMLYRLEEQLPTDAESLTATFAPAVGGRCLGIAADTARIQAMIDRLAGLGLDVISVSPVALLASWGTSGREGEACDCVIVSGVSAVDIVRLVDRRLTRWQTIPANAEEVRRCLEVDLLERPIEGRQPLVRLVGPLPDRTAIGHSDAETFSVSEAAENDPFVAAARASRRLLDGEAPQWMDLRRDRLALPDAWKRVGRPLAAAGVLFLVFSAALAGLFILRGVRYAGIVQERERSQAALFQSLYPDQGLPVNVKARFKSDLTRLGGISGTGFDVPNRTSALDMLQQLTGGLPPSVRLRILEMRIEPDSIYVEGQVQSHGDAEVISRALGRSGFEMAAPRTESLASGGVSFILMGKPAGRKDAVKPVRTVEVKR